MIPAFLGRKKRCGDKQRTKNTSCCSRGANGRLTNRPESFDSAITVEKLLYRPEGCLVQFHGTSQQVEVHAKFHVQRLGIITDHIETTAFGGPLRSKSANDDMATIGSASRTRPTLRLRLSKNTRAGQVLSAEPV